VGERWQRLLLTLQRYPGRTERPHSRLAKACRHLAAAQKRESRAWGDLHKIEGRIARQQQTIDEHQAALLSLEAWSVSLDTDNRANPNPVPMVVRLDAGFSTGLNLTWLIEMGYTVLTKAHHSSTAQSLHRPLSAQPVWTGVGKNAEAVAMGAYEQNECPYPRQAMLVRWTAAWAKALLAEANQNFITALDQVKTLVRVVSHTRARWVRNACGHTLIFDEQGPFAGTVICLSGWVAVQLPLRLFNAL